MTFSPKLTVVVKAAAHLWTSWVWASDAGRESKLLIGLLTFLLVFLDSGL